MHGFGPVIREEDEPVFHADWERRIHAVGLALILSGAWSVDEWRFFIEQMEPAQYLRASYYERWLHSVEDLLVEKKVATRAELEAGHLMTSGKGHNAITPVTREQVAPFFQHGGSLAMAAAEAPRFKIGDVVIARNINPLHHTRVPRYARGKRGSVVALHGGFAFADTRAQGLGDNPQHLYTVRFEGAELWGPDAEPREALYLNMYDSYLDPAA
jgi:nitrile hydratase